MNPLAFTALTVLAATGIALPSYAGNREITPFNLVERASRGDFASEGIAGGAIFELNVATNKVIAEDLVEAAISKDRLDENALQNEKYLSDVEFQLAVRQNGINS
ncbi:MAG: hypothetical protein AAGG02_15300 [Cyanobacteria bacterium P01_H01_bin.15]